MHCINIYCTAVHFKLTQHGFPYLMFQLEGFEDFALL